MSKYIAFLRAINVTNRFVKMEDLRELFVQMAFNDVETYIQSGNVIFSTTETDEQILEAKIETHLENALGFAVPTMIRNQESMMAIANSDPFPQIGEMEKATSYVSFLKETPAPELQEKLEALSDGMDTFLIQQRELHWLYDRTKGQSKMTNGKVEKILKVAATRRNMNTVQKITKKYFGL